MHTPGFQAKVISFINLKGGVGKTSCAVNIAATLASRQIMWRGKLTNPNILFIDIDPQSNASVTWLSEEVYYSADESGKTVAHIFKKLLSGEDDRTPDISDFIIPCSFKVEAKTESKVDHYSIDLLPSSLTLIDLQDKLWQYRSQYRSLIGILGDVLAKLSKTKKSRAYTHIIIDCPPSLGAVTLNALSISDHLVIPVFLDAFSHWGLEQIGTRLDHIRNHNAMCDASLLGVLFSQFDNRMTRMNEAYEDKLVGWLEAKGHEPEMIFKTKIKRSEAVRKAEAFHRPVISFEGLDRSDRDQRDNSQQDWDSVVTEIIGRLGQTPQVG
jgi:chromosome partitioning protein